MHIMLLLASLNSCCNPWIYMAFSGTLTSRGRLWVSPCCSKRDKFRAKTRGSLGYAMHHSTTKTTSVASTPLTPTTSKNNVNGILFDVSPDWLLTKIRSFTEFYFCTKIKITGKYWNESAFASSSLRKYILCHIHIIFLCVYIRRPNAWTLSQEFFNYFNSYKHSLENLLYEHVSII